MSVAAASPKPDVEHLEELVDVLLEEVRRLIDGVSSARADVASVASKVDGVAEQLRKHTEAEEERSNRMEARLGQLERLSATWAGPTGASP